jgi:hypothetical protein
MRKKKKRDLVPSRIQGIALPPHARRLLLRIRGNRCTEEQAYARGRMHGQEIPREKGHEIPLYSIPENAPKN